MFTLSEICWVPLKCNNICGYDIFWSPYIASDNRTYLKFSPGKAATFRCLTWCHGSVDDKYAHIVGMVGKLECKIDWQFDCWIFSWCQDLDDSASIDFSISFLIDCIYKSVYGHTCISTIRRQPDTYHRSPRVDYCLISDSYCQSSVHSWACLSIDIDVIAWIMLLYFVNSRLCREYIWTITLNYTGRGRPISSLFSTFGYLLVVNWDNFPYSWYGITNGTKIINYAPQSVFPINQIDIKEVNITPSWADGGAGCRLVWVFCVTLEKKTNCSEKRVALMSTT